MLKSESTHAAPGSKAFALELATTPGSAALLFSNQALPTAIQVDESQNRLLARRVGVGVQVYDYDSAHGKWAFREPQADLYDIKTGVQRGIHFAGPYWADADGSRVKGQLSGDVAAPVDSARNVKWLKLDAVEWFGCAEGIFSQVTFIQRVVTYGGQAPSNWQPTGGDTVSVPYTALYVFWAAKEQ
jgi:hypothetical protein